MEMTTKATNAIDIPTSMSEPDEIFIEEVWVNSATEGCTSHRCHIFQGSITLHQSARGNMMILCVFCHLNQENNY